MNIGRILVNIIVVFLLLILFSFVGAVTFPGLSTQATLETTVSRFLLLLLPVLILSIVAVFLGIGVRSIKNSFQALGLAYVSAMIIGGILALLTLLNFPYSAHINFAWLGVRWYDPWLTFFLVGAPILLTFVV